MLCFFAGVVHGFAPGQKFSRAFDHSAISFAPSRFASKTPCCTRSTVSTILHSTPSGSDKSKVKNLNSAVDGSGWRLNGLGALSFLLCIWIFSLPPEFRRTHLCSSNVCVENRASCHDCLTFGEWKDKIGDYYKAGGGIQFDFSIDPATRRQFEANFEK